MNNDPASCYVAVCGSRWYTATWDPEMGRPVTFYYFPVGRQGHDWDARMFIEDGEIVVERDGDVAAVYIPVAVMAEFMYRAEGETV